MQSGFKSRFGHRWSAQRGTILLIVVVTMFVFMGITGVMILQASQYAREAQTVVASRGAMTTACAGVDLVVADLVASEDALLWFDANVINNPIEYLPMRYGTAPGQVAFVSRTRHVGQVRVDEHGRLAEYMAPLLLQGRTSAPTPPLPTAGSLAAEWRQSTENSSGSMDSYLHSSHRFITRFTFFKEGVAVDPSLGDDFDRAVLEGISTYDIPGGGGNQVGLRVVEASLEITPGLDFGGTGAIISIMVPDNVDARGSGKSFAQDGHISVDRGSGYTSIEGQLISNGGVSMDGVMMRNGQNFSSYITRAGTSPLARARLAGTAAELPNYTGMGSADQLFDFDRYEAAGVAMNRVLDVGINSNVFNTLVEFGLSQRWHNSRNQRMNGVVVLRVNALTEGSGPKIEDSGVMRSGRIGITRGSVRPASDPVYPGIYSGGIHIQGTMVWRFRNVTGFYKVFIETPLYVNPSNWGPGYETPRMPPLPMGDGGYPPVYDIPERNPTHPTVQAAMIAAGHMPFLPGDDMPAIMYDNGVVDIHHDCSISGMVYGPNFGEIENKHGMRQAFNGTIMLGGGIYLEGGSGPGGQAFAFNGDAMDNLAVFHRVPSRAIITSFTIVQ